MIGKEVTMEEKRWTEAQLEAITCDRPDILVSAAAGSGKTAVLTKRIIDKLTDNDHPADISRMLIVTFTKAAAGELRERIADALNKAIALSPSNKRLQRQYVLLSKAKITTIHGFCLDLIKQNFEALDLSPSVSVSDESQSTLLMEQVADVILDNYYEGIPGYDDIDDFISFADNFIALQDERLATILISLYNKLASYPEGISFLTMSAEEFRRAEQGGIFVTVWGQLVLEQMASAFRYYKAVMERACGFFDCDDYRDKYLPSFRYEADYADSLLNAAESGDADSIRKWLFAHSPVSLKPVKKDLQTEECQFYRDERKSFSECINKFAEDYFSSDDESVREAAKQSREILEKLHRFLSAFEAKYRYEKRIRGLLDFNDLERLAHRLLIREDGSPSDIATAVSSQFDEIYIDEYQDVNKLQDGIFAAIASRSDRFMVGDIKQSIYGFRGAEPSLFADYRRNDSVHKVYLSHNFRCDGAIIDFVNTICGRLFTLAGKTVPYDKTDALVCGKGERGEHPVELTVIDSSERSAADRRSAEATYVAKRIRSLLKEGVAPKDICILLRSASRSSAIFEEALTKNGISCRNQVTKDLFVNPEVLLVISLLHVIDNPTRDIHLVAVLKSPLYNFSLSELARIRKYRSNGSLYEALMDYCRDFDFSKGRYFLDKLSEYRVRATEPVDQLIRYLYNDAEIFAYATGGRDDVSASSRRANLLLLYDYARRFESGSFRGLYNFIRYITDVIESDAVTESAPTTADHENTVRIMTIHQSKGLEFPVVFLCDCGSAFNEADTHERVLLDRTYGVTLKYADRSGLASFDTVFRRAEAMGIAAKNREEEIRVLYVALTRAIHRLIVTGASSKAESLTTRCRILSDIASEETGYLFRACNHYLSWLLIAGGTAYRPLVVTVEADEEESATPLPFESSAEPRVPDEKRVQAFLEEYRRRFAYSYPTEDAAALPAKLSVSELYPSILDEYDDALKLSDTRKRRMKVPRFYSKEETSSTDRGTATHQFMQFCHFAELERYGIDAEIERMVSNGFLDTKTADMIDRSMLEGFLRSDLFPVLCEADDLMREVRFNVRLPASSFTEREALRESLADETILVQGIIDGVYTDAEGRLTLIDYKTDRVPSDKKDDICGFKRLLIERHKEQLSYYRAACRYLFCRSVDRVLLYSFALGETVEVPLDVLREL